MQGKEKLASAGEITIEREALNQIDPKTAGPSKDGSQLSYGGPKRDDVNNTALLKI